MGGSDLRYAGERRVDMARHGEWLAEAPSVGQALREHAATPAPAYNRSARPDAAAPGRCVCTRRHATPRPRPRKALHRCRAPSARPTRCCWRASRAREAAAGRLTAIVTAEPADTQRLEQELAFFAPGLRIAVFPDWETLPYDTFSPHQDLISERLATLWRILQARAQRDLDVVLVPASTALVRLAPPSFLAAYTFNFRQKEKLDEAALKAQLTLAGYTHVSQVVSPGEYAVRGGLIDLFPMGSAVPYRVDLFGDEVDSIRTFDPDTQRSLYPVPEVRLLPGREFPLDEAARTAFRARWREKMEGDPSKVRLYKDIGAGPRRRRHRVLPAAVLRADGDAVRLPRRRRDAGAARRGRRGAASASGPTRASATASCSTTASGRSWRRRSCS